MPTVRRASFTSSISRCPSSRRRTCGGPSSRCCTACSRSSRRAAPSRRRRSPASPSTRRWRGTGRTSPTCRNPLVIADVGPVFAGSGFALFAEAASRGAVVRAVPGPGAAGRPRSFFDRLETWAKEQGAPGLGWLALGEGTARGPIAKFLDAERLGRLREATGTKSGDCIFFACERREVADLLAGKLRTQARRRARSGREARLPLLLDHGLPHVRVG